MTRYQWIGSMKMEIETRPKAEEAAKPKARKTKAKAKEEPKEEPKEEQAPAEEAEA